MEVLEGSGNPGRRPRVPASLIKGNIQLTDKDRKKLTLPMKKILRQVHATKTPKKAVIQHGDGISQILRFILPVIGSAISAI